MVFCVTNRWNWINAFIPMLMNVLYNFFPLFFICFIQIVESLIFIGFEVLTAVIMFSSIFWDIALWILLKVSWHFCGTCRLHLKSWRSQVSIFTCFMLGFSVAYSSTLKIEATWSSVTSSDFRGTTRRRIQELELFINFCHFFKLFYCANQYVSHSLRVSRKDLNEGRDCLIWPYVRDGGHAVA
jgi:hypothetical protein